MSRLQGRCPFCRILYSLNADGTVRGHPNHWEAPTPFIKPWCPGSHEQPQPLEGEAEQGRTEDARTMGAE